MTQNLQYISLTEFTEISTATLMFLNILFIVIYKYWDNENIFTIILIAFELILLSFSKND